MLTCLIIYSVLSFYYKGKYTCTNYKHVTMEHSELVAEMVHVERLTTQERLHLARHRRLQQLKVWRQREKEWLRHQTRHMSNKRHIYFSDSVMLLEAAARNDIDEGKRFLYLGNKHCQFVISIENIYFFFSKTTFEERSKSRLNKRRWFDGATSMLHR